MFTAVWPCPPPLVFPAAQPLPKPAKSQCCHIATSMPSCCLLLAIPPSTSPLHFTCRFLARDVLSRQGAGLEALAEPSVLAEVAADRVDTRSSWEPSGLCASLLHGIRCQHLPVAEACTLWLTTQSKALQQVCSCSGAMVVIDDSGPHEEVEMPMTLVG